MGIYLKPSSCSSICSVSQNFPAFFCRERTSFIQACGFHIFFVCRTAMDIEVSIEDVRDIEEDEGPLTSTPVLSRPRRHSARREMQANHFLDGTARIGLSRISDSLSHCLSESSSSMDTSSFNDIQKKRVKLCPVCPSVLQRLSNAFEAAGCHSKELLRRKSSHKNPKKSTSAQHRNLKEQNAWIKCNLFDSQGNYSYCQACILAFLRSARRD